MGFASQNRHFHNAKQAFWEREKGVVEKASTGYGDLEGKREIANTLYEYIQGSILNSDIYYTPPSTYVLIRLVLANTS